MIYGRYSTVLKNLMDNEQTAAALQKALSTYPIYEPKNPALYNIIPTRDEINTKLLNHYKYREIGFETVGRFLDELEISMCEIMPYYNQLMSSEDMMNKIEDIFGNIDITESYQETSSGNSQSSSEGSMSATSENSSETSSESNTDVNGINTSKTISSETPANELSITATEIDSVGYADNAMWNKDDNTSSSTTENTGRTSDNGTSSNTTESSSNVETSGTVTHTLNRKGNQGVNTYAHDMLEFRELFLNVVQQIINDERIAELFMTVY